MIKTYSLKDITYKGVKYKFKTPLKIKIDNFLCMDYKTYGGEMSIPSVLGGYTRQTPFPDDATKDIKDYIKTVFDEYLFKNDNDLDEYERKYKQDWINLFVPPKKKK